MGISLFFFIHQRKTNFYDKKNSIFFIGFTLTHKLLQQYIQFQNYISKIPELTFREFEKPPTETTNISNALVKGIVLVILIYERQTAIM